VCARERERSLIVIEHRSRPARRVMADRAVRGETRLHMVRVCRCLIIGLVTRIAIRRRPGKFSVDVALRARNIYVRPGQRKHRLRVIEDRACPRRRRVADGAVGRETRLHVVRICRPVVVLNVAGVAIRRRPGKSPVDVALRARDAHMSAG